LYHTVNGSVPAGGLILPPEFVPGIGSQFA